MAHFQSFSFSLSKITSLNHHNRMSQKRHINDQLMLSSTLKARLCHAGRDEIWMKLTLFTWSKRVFSLSGLCQLWRLRRGVEHWGAGTSVFQHWKITHYITCNESVWFTLCPFRLRWSAGLCCRRPMTSVMRSLCVGWPGSPGRRRSVTQLSIGRVYQHLCLVTANRVND